MNKELEKILNEIPKPRKKVINVPLVEEKHINVSGEDAVGDAPEMRNIETIDPDKDVIEDQT